jgi:hypothetical protein
VAARVYFPAAFADIPDFGVRNSGTSRKVEIVGMAANPGGPWIEQMARNLVDAVDCVLVGKR